MSHVIEKLVFEVSTATPSQARAIQHELSEGVSEKVLQALEAMFNHLAAKGMHLRLDQINIDLGSLKPQNLEAQITAKLLPLLEQKLVENQSPQDVSLFEPLTNLKLESQLKSQFESWIYFMQQGVLPWWQGVQNFNANQLLSDLLKKQPQLMLQILQSFSGTKAQLRVKKQLSLASHLQLSQTLTQQNDYKQVVEFINFWQALKQSGEFRPSVQFNMSVIDHKYWLSELNANLIDCANLPADTRHFEQALNQANSAITTKLNLHDKLALFRLIAVKSISKSLSPNGVSALFRTLISLDYYSQVQEIAEHLHKLNLVEQQQIQQQLIQAGFNRNVVQQLAPAPTFSKKIKPVKFKSHSSIAEKSSTSFIPNINKFALRLSTQTAQFKSARLLNNEPSSSAWRELKSTQSPYIKDDKNSATIPTEGYIANAGLIILWPFLKPFFSAVGLVEANQFISPEHQERAIQLLHYAVYGTNEINEQQLLLNKILCGWPISNSVESTFMPTDIEMTQITDLFSSVTQHWQPLKNTSLEGFISAFLMREGKLTQEEYGWKLLVNRKGMDVLLDQIPWGIGMAHLPWMQATVYTEW